MSSFVGTFIVDCKSKLKERFLISEKQAQAILEIRLARLTKLEVNNLREEIAALLKTIEYLTGVVGSKRKQLGIVKSELLDIRKRYKLERRSHIFVDGIEQKIQVYDVNEVEEKKGYCILTNQNCIKFLTTKTYKGANKTAQNCSSEDIPMSIVQCSRSFDYFDYFVNVFNGNYYTLQNVLSCLCICKLIL